MMAIVTAGNGGYEQLEYRRVRVPQLGPAEALLHVLAAGVNNTDINTRIGWYSSAVTADTAAAANVAETSTTGIADGWNGPSPFPFIQGADCCGRVIAVGSASDSSLIGTRVLVRACMHTQGFAQPDCIWLGSDFDGAFAQFVKVPVTEVFPVKCDWSDAELGSIPCAYGTAENMLIRARVRSGEHVLVSGASGGVGSAVVQLAKGRGANVTAIASRAKHAEIIALGADRVLDRTDDLVAVLGKGSVDIAVDNVAGPAFGEILRTIKRGGRYVSSGAIGGPLVTLDMRTLYLNDLTLIGCTSWAAAVVSHLVSYIESGAIRPLVAKIFPLERIADAQRSFLEKKHVGKFVLIPPPLDL